MRTVLTIGTFDGVHAGHRALVERARAVAGAGGRVVAMVFDPHPATVLRPGSAPARVSGFDERRRLLLAAGADVVERLLPTPELLSHTPRAFVEDLVRRFAPVAIVEGTDFRFGRGREGDVLVLEALGREFGFALEVVSAVEVGLSDRTMVRASSSVVRWLLEQGRVRDAAIVLGRPWMLEGTVERGDRRGREIGFPTANLATEQMIPGNGIYACRAVLPDGRRLAAGVHVGPRDTFGDARRVVEAHLINPGREAERIAGLDEYGWSIRLEFIAWLRDPAKFESVAQLVEQMRHDCRRAEEVVSRETEVMEVPA